MASLTREEVRFYVGRENIETKQQQVIHDNYNDLYTVSEDFNQSNGYKEVSTANREATRLNASEADKAKERGREIKWHYFTYRKDNKVTTLANYKLPKKEKEEEKDDEVIEEESIEE